MKKRKKVLILTLSLCLFLVALYFYLIKNKERSVQLFNKEKSEIVENNQDIGQFIDSQNQKEIVKESQALNDDYGEKQESISRFIASKKNTDSDNKEVQMPGQENGGKNEIITSGTIPYKNTKFGFQMMLPSGWDNYKENVTNEKVEISLPTKDPGFNGFAPVIDILIYSLSGWNDYLKKCKENPSPNCFDDDSVSAKSDQYVFIVTLPDNLLPDDLLPINSNGIVNNYFKIIRDSFRLL